MGHYFIRVGYSEEYDSDGTHLLFYPKGKVNPIKFTREQIMNMFDEAYLSGLINKPSKKHMSDLHFGRIIRRHG